MENPIVRFGVPLALAAAGSGLYAWREHKRRAEPVSRDLSAEEQTEEAAIIKLISSIAEETSRKEGFVHRGVACDGCSASPIRGLRFKCVNCNDFDLCELCESTGTKHLTTHTFMKIRIPIPPLANSKNFAMQCSYPGSSRWAPKVSEEEMAKLQRDTQFDKVELEALLEQYSALVTGPSGIDKETFELGLGPLASEKNLITDRIFQFFDTDGDGAISFKEFVSGLSVLCGGTQEEKIQHAFRGYDLDGDGYICKEEMHAMFKAYFNLSLRLVRHMMHSLEDELMDGFDEESTKPVSSVFTAPIPAGASDADPVPGQNSKAGSSASLHAGSEHASDEYGNVVDTISEEAITEMVEKAFATADTDKDGLVSFEEFKVWTQRDPSSLEFLDSFGSVF